MVASRVAWTRGPACFELAEALSDGEPIGATDDLKRACIANGVELLVTKKFTSFDLVPTVVPHELDLGTIKAVTAAVADGPHSPLAVDVAARVGQSLGVPVSIATAYHSNEDRTVAEERLDRLQPAEFEVERVAVPSDSALAIVDALSTDTLLVIGAPGGSWFQRQLFGPGHKLAVAAPAGAVLVKSQPRRSYMEAEDATGVALSLHLSTDDGRRIMTDSVAPVVDEGKLVGMLRRRTLEAAVDAAIVADVMEPPVSVSAEEPLDNAADLAEFLDGGPVPVTGDNETLLGIIRI